MKILLSGATGFIGTHVLRILIRDGHQIHATAHHARHELPENFPRDQVIYCPYHAGKENTGFSQSFRVPETVIHLAWEGLPRYREAFHKEKVLPEQITFLEDLLRNGCRNLIVSGTCLEYGLQEGCLSEDMDARPVTAYAEAKYQLHQHLLKLQEVLKFKLNWLRLFYTWGPGQNPASLIPQLEQAIREGRKSFDMSHGEQIRDFVPVQKVAACIARLAANDSNQGIVNICSGRGQKVKDFVTDYLKEHSADLVLNTGVYPVPDYEPFAFWGNDSKLKRLVGVL